MNAQTFKRYLELQLFLSLISLPLLLAWGLPISLASLAGNLIFAPFLTIFLLVSSLFFVAQLMQLPSSWLAQLLELITHTWLWLLRWGSDSWLCELPSPPLWILLGIVAATLAILMNRRFTQHQRIIAFACLLAASCFIVRFWQQEPNTFLVATKGWHSVTIMHSETHTALIDRGGLQHAGRSWARFVLKPELIKRLGRSKLDYCVVITPRPKTLNNVANMCSTIKVGTVFLARWKDKESATFWNSLGSLRYACRKNKTKLMPFVSLEQVALARAPAELPHHEV